MKWVGKYGKVRPSAELPDEPQNANGNRLSPLIRYELHRTLTVFLVLSGRPISSNSAGPPRVHPR